MDVNEFAVFNQFEEGYLTIASPSTYQWNPEGAIRYSTPALAWKAARQRNANFIKAVKLVRDEEGRLTHEDLPIPNKAAPGTWVVKVITEAFSDRQPLYVTSVGRDKKIKLSTELCDARGFSQEDAQGLVDGFAGRPGTTATQEQMPVA